MANKPLIKDGKLVGAPITNIDKLSSNQQKRLLDLMNKKHLNGDDARELLNLRSAAK